MSPTLEIGDRVLAFKYWPVRWLRKGQIILFWPPSQYISTGFGNIGNIPFIKRIVGVHGDFISRYENDSSQKDEMIPPGYFSVRGDLFVNQNDKYTIGPIPFSSLMALVIMKLPRRENNLLVTNKNDKAS